MPMLIRAITLCGADKGGHWFKKAIFWWEVADGDVADLCQVLIRAIITGSLLTLLLVQNICNVEPCRLPSCIPRNTLRKPSLLKQRCRTKRGSC